LIVIILINISLEKYLKKLKRILKEVKQETMKKFDVPIFFHSDLVTWIRNLELERNQLELE
jgi:hypothetical protein